VVQVPQQPAAPQENDVDRARAAGALAFEREIAYLSQKADDADIAWRRYVQGCRLEITSATAAAVGGGRDWFGVAYVNVTTSRPTEACAEAGNFYALTAQVKAGMCVAEERAHKSWVYPGTRRDIPLKYRLDWDGWDRVCI
jgi:hypothetical protein